MTHRAPADSQRTRRHKGHQPHKPHHAVRPSTYPQHAPAPHPRTGLNAALTFDTFVPGSANRHARTIALATAYKPGHDRNPLCIHGGPGTGKTHLLNALGNRALDVNPNLKVLCTSGASIAGACWLGVAHRSALIRRCSAIDLLIIDGIMTPHCDAHAADVMAIIMMAVIVAGGQVVFSCDADPRMLSADAPRLGTVAAATYAVGLRPPTLETRLAILRMLNITSDAPVPDNMLAPIARHATGNVHDLRSTYARVSLALWTRSKPLRIRHRRGHGSAANQPSSSLSDGVP